MFHLLRRQVMQPTRKPLIVMTPKSLLRSKAATSKLKFLTDGRFQQVIGDRGPGEAEEIKRVVFCSGKVYYDLAEKRDAENVREVAVMRVEQLYPFPEADLRGFVEEFPNATEVVWCQEEPQNQGAWYQSRHHLAGLYRPTGRNSGMSGGRILHHPQSAITRCTWKSSRHWSTRLFFRNPSNDDRS